MGKTFKEKSTSSNYLSNRINMNRNSQNNFDHWSINQFPKLNFKSNILDLGCGTGKQILSFGQFLTKSTKYYACDISKESINEVQKNYSLFPQLNLINQSFDDIQVHIDNKIKFDLIYSFYALYYSDNIEKLLNSIYRMLKKDGIFWVVIPYKNTNKEIFSILQNIYSIPEKVIYSVDGFALDLIKKAQKTGFKNIETSLFENKIFFDSTNSVLDYLKSTTFYNEQYSKNIESTFSKLCENGFSVTKEVISIKLGK